VTSAVYVSAFVPDRSAGHAGGQAAGVHLARLRERHAHVEAIVCTTERIGRVQGLQVIAQTTGGFVDAMARHLGRSLTRWLAASVVHTRLNERFIAAIRDALLRTKPDVLFCDFTQSHLAGILAADQAGLPVEIQLCCHDVLAQRCLRSARLRERWLMGWVSQEESALVRRADRVLALSEKDAQLLQSLYLAERVEVLPFCPPAWVERVNRDERVPGRVLFFGNFEREENRDGARWFARECAPRVHAAHADFHFVLAGTGSDRMVAELGRHSWLSATGYIEDPASEFSLATLCVAPLDQGAGVKFKVLEALAAATPVIATPTAAEGIARHEMLRVVPRDAFADALIALL
jgi:glycosyltransferase involved in cell wall biosynthesis